MAVAALFAACHSSNKVTEKLAVKFLKPESDTLKLITLDNSQIKFSDVYQPNGSENVYFINKTGTLLWSLNTSNYSVHSVCELPNLIIDMGFTVNEKEKELVFYCNAKDSLYVFDLGGEMKESMTFAPEREKGIWINCDSRYFLPHRKGNILYSSIFPDMYDGYKKRKYYKQAIEGEYNLLTKTLKLFPQTYPQNFQDNCYGVNYAPHREVLKDNWHAYTFAYNDSIFLYNIKTGEKKQHYFGTRTEKTFLHIPFQKMGSVNTVAIMELMKDNPTYVNFKPMLLSGYFVRYYYANLGKEASRSSGVIIYNKEFDYIGEVKVGEFKGMVFDSKTGLLKVKFEKEKLIISKIKW